MEIFICTQLLFLPKVMWIRNGIYAVLAGELMVGHLAVAWYQVPLAGQRGRRGSKNPGHTVLGAVLPAAVGLAEVGLRGGTGQPLLLTLLMKRG